MDMMEMLDFYEVAISDCRSRGLSRTDAKNEARDKLYAAYPNTVNGKNGKITAGEKDVSVFWSAVSRIVEKYYGKKPTSQSNQQMLLPKPIPPAKKDETFWTTIQRAAQTGFIPFGEYLEPFVSGKRDQVHAYISRLRSIGYECRRIEHGWIVKKVETEAERISREIAVRERIEAERKAAMRQEIESKIEAAKARAASEIEELVRKLVGG